MKDFEPVKVENCQHCGYPMRQYNPNSMMMVCESCGTRNEPDAQPPRYKPEIPLNPLFKLHAYFEMQGTTWQVIGCQSYSGVIDEWDQEDSAWEQTPWYYNSWWVLNEAREIAWIVQDKTGYSWSRKTTVTSGIPQGDRSYEVGRWTLLSAVGEFSYHPREDEQVISYEKNNRSLEVLLDKEGQNQEIEAFMSTPISLADLLTAFDKTDALQSLKRAKLAMQAALACIVLLIVGFVALQFLEQKVLSFPEQRITTQSLKQAIPLGEFNLPKSGLLGFSVNASLAAGNGSFDGMLIVKDSDRAKVAEVPVSFWRESGWDSDGAWTESQTAHSPRIVLPAGDRYQVSLMPNELKRWSSIRIRGTLTRNKAASLPIILGVIVAVLLAFFLNRMRRKRLRTETGVGA